MKKHLPRGWARFAIAGVITALVAGMGSTLPNAYAAGTIKASDDQWISIGMGIRTSFVSQQDAAPNGDWSKDFGVNNARIYINGQIHKYVGFTFNTECFNCAVGSAAGGAPGSGQFGGNSTIGLLDAIGRFEFNEKINLWVGRTLLPSERGELNGPFYHATFDGFRTPFYPADFSANFQSGPAGGNGGIPQAGLYGRDNAAVFFGKFHPAFGTHFLYAAAVSTGLRGGPNTSDSLMYTGRLQWNLLNDEVNPGYYTSGTYYGTAGDIIAIAGNVQYQKDGAGNLATNNISDFTGISVDFLLEKLIPNNRGVFTFNGEFKQFFANYGAAAFTAPATCFCIFDGISWSVNGLYLMPNEIGIGRFQPYMRFVSINPTTSAMRQEWEYGVNYVISGHNARISVFGRYGDLQTKSFQGNFSPDATGNRVNSVWVALQLQY